MMLVFVLLTFGGWNEAVYLSAELRDGRRRMGHAMILGLIVVSVLYLLVNLAYLRALSLGGMAASGAVAADVMDRSSEGRRVGKVGARPCRLRWAPDHEKKKK